MAVEARRTGPRLLTDAQTQTAQALEREQHERGKAEDAMRSERAATGARRRSSRSGWPESEYGRTMQVAYQEWPRGTTSLPLWRLLNGTRADLRGWEWHYVHRLCHADQLTLQGHKNALGWAVFSPNGARVLTVSRTNRRW